MVLPYEAYHKVHKSSPFKHNKCKIILLIENNNSYDLHLRRMISTMCFLIEFHTDRYLSNIFIYTIIEEAVNLLSRVKSTAMIRFMLEF